jgi:ureidoglycolate dehydrogenase (NAD+)
LHEAPGRRYSGPPARHRPDTGLTAASETEAAQRHTDGSDHMTKTSIIADETDLTRFAVDVLMKRGMNREDAATVAGALVWADMRDVGSHGVFRLPRYMAIIDKGDIDPRARIEQRLALPAALVFEANKAFGPVAMMHATKAACEQAKRAGVCYAIVSHTTHTGAIGYFANWAAERGFAAIVASAGSANMAYHGARKPSLSTSPLAIAVPGGSAGPIALDMSTAIAGIGRLAQARERGETLPEGMALDDNGDPTTDPAKASLPLPLGGAKGSGLALMLECLAGLMAGTPLLAGMIAPGGKIWHSHNAIVIAMDVAQFRPVADFEKDAEALAASIKQLPRRPGFDELLLPGERGNRAYALSKQTGVAISPGTWAELEKLAAGLGVAMAARKAA